jgi:hypothetical protein
MPIEICCFYAHEDRLLLDGIKTHLTSLQRHNLINWHDYDISPQTEQKQNSDKHLNTAQIILLLVSPDFMASDFCYSLKMKQAIERHKRGKTRVIPIIVRPTVWKDTPFEMLQTLPTDAKPVTMWSDRDAAFLTITSSIRKVVEELSTTLQTIEFSIELGDMTSFKADVLALKYAQMFLGTDKIVADLLNQVGTPIDKLRPDVDDYCYVPTQNCIQARYALFVGVPVLLHFNYQRIQEFAARVLHVLAFTAPATKHLAMTVHGAGFGLDEIEAFLAQFRGYLYGLQNKQYPTQLEKITIIDNNIERVRRLQQVFEANFASADFITKIKDRWAYRIDKQQLNGNSEGNQQHNRIGAKRGMESDAKPHVFVAMPFKKDMDDVFYYGIQQPVRDVGFICERVDQEAFIGDILEQVKLKIETATVVIAELSGANPNVYLEVGYAWGKGRPTILLIKDEEELRFDVRGQRCLKYNRIQDLEDCLKKELNELKSKGFIK